MKKVLCILTLLCAVFTGAWADKTAELWVSDAPSNGEWAEHTYWYFMKNYRSGSEQNGAGGTYRFMSTGEGYLNGENIKLESTNRDTNDTGLWCIVSDGNGAYHFYNKAKGTMYILQNSGTSGSKMVASTTTQNTSFSLHRRNNQAGVDSWGISMGTSNSNYWDGNGTELKTWDNSTNSPTNNNGSFVFEAPVEYDYMLGTYKAHSEMHYIKPGTSYPTASYSHDFVSCGQSPEGNVEKQEVVEIQLTEDNPYFRAYNSYEEIATWYTWCTNPNDNGTHFYIRRNTDTDKLTSGGINKPLIDSDDKNNFLWGFIGNVIEGYQVVNYAKGKGYNINKDFSNGISMTDEDVRYQITSESSRTPTCVMLITRIAGGSTYGTDLQGANSDKTGGSLKDWSSGSGRQSKFEEATPYDHVITSEEISALQAKIDAVIAKTSASAVGYPAHTNSAVTTLANYITVLGTPYVTAANYNDALAALNAVYAINDVNLPESGKAYYIKGRYANGATKYLVHNGSHSLTLRDTPEAFIVGSAAGSKYVLVGEDNYYFAVTANGKDANVHEAYDADKCAITLAHVAPNFNGSSTYTEGNPEVYFGTLAIQGKCGDETFYIMSQPTTGTLLNSWPNYVAYNTQSDNYLSSLFEFEKVENPNKLKLSNPNPEGTSGLDNKSVGTFSAPFAVQLPTGVEAYKATVDGSTVTFETIGSVVPANTGVLVYASDGTTYNNANAVPAAAVGSIVEGNALRPANGTIEAGDYVLGNGTNGVGFYARLTETNAKNKAYIPASAAPQINAFRFDFEEQTTGVESLQSEQTTGVAFDLAGRRINANAKGISIMNGKKYIK